MIISLAKLKIIMVKPLEIIQIVYFLLKYDILRAEEPLNGQKILAQGRMMQILKLKWTVQQQ